MEKHKRIPFRFIRIILLGIALVPAIVSKSYSQSPGREATLEYLNRLGGDSIQFSLKGTQLQITYSGKEGKVVRYDKAQTTDLDTVAKFESSSRLVSVNCLADVQDCVTRELIVQKIKRNYGRISIPATEETAVAYKTALQHLIKILTVKKYNDEILLP